MKPISQIFKGLSLTVLAAGTIATAAAQVSTLPVCSGTGSGKIYFVSHDSVFVMTPSNPTGFSYTGITMPGASVAGGPTASALAVSANLNGGSPSLTYYTTVFNGTTRILHYWNGTSWISTGAVLNSDNIAGGGGYIFSYDPASGIVFRSTGTGSPVFVGNASGGASLNNQSSDIAADCSGNYYVIFQGASPAILKKFDPTGSLLATYTLAGTYSTGGGGLAVNGNEVYYDGANGKLYSGIISGTTVTFTASASNPFNSFPASDMASCGYSGYQGNQGTSDTINICDSASNLVLKANGPGPYTWTVVSGNATITGSGSSVIVNASSSSVITHLDANCSGINVIPDTTVLRIARATVNAGPDRTIISCGQQLTDSITAVLSDTSGSILYGYNWTPKAVIFGGTDVTLVPTFQISKSTQFILDVYTLNGCHWYDTVNIKVVDSTPKAAFEYQYYYGCSEDTVVFFNTSYPVSAIDSFAWNFRDSVGYNGAYYYTDAIAPTHIFKEQGFYPVVLLVKNQYCTDTINKLINVSHPLLPDFDIDDSTACLDHLFRFTDKSILPCSNPYWRNLPECVTYLYDFGDGTTSTLSKPTHKYSKPGTYVVTLTLTDGYLHCTASKSHTVVADPVPVVNIITDDSSICQGQTAHLKADYSSVGFTDLNFNMGDGTIFQDSVLVAYTYTEPGTYFVVLTANYRYCPPGTVTLPLKVNPFPSVDLGPDTALCPNGSPIILSDRKNLGNTAAQYVWNTGETTPSIAARTIGTYWARVRLAGCENTDSILIKKACYVDIPNSFTPNGDGVNDYFLPRETLSHSVASFKLDIFNRWGQKIFNSEVTDGRGWDGKFNGVDQPQGVYVYMLDVQFTNGTHEHYTGNLTLLR
ncbi:MAG: gliding motility-associated C-terminal domain-containing protein [Bacteroidetes bacterium]|nr:gliding motility-associated C-terminal domain-containing protein [Bacteroidota bacterium]MBS1628809.1 gliding motility-associated C-terminal domain-containing protein [Bacteroidota bacterium]